MGNRTLKAGGAAQDVHVTPGYGPWKQTSIRSTTDPTQHGDLPRIENDGGNSWKPLYATVGGSPAMMMMMMMTTMMMIMEDVWDELPGRNVYTDSRYHS